MPRVAHFTIFHQQLTANWSACFKSLTIEWLWLILLSTKNITAVHFNTQMYTICNNGSEWNKHWLMPLFKV